jgi:phospholipid/cholesterol/gamma-HCH transport system permease protein
MIESFIVRTGRLFFTLAGQLALFLRHVNYVSELVVKTAARSHLFIKNLSLTFHQMYVIGIESLPLVIVTSVFVGGEAVLQANFQFAGLVPLRYLGYAVSKALITELCPVLTSFVVASRISTAIAAEIGAMRISEQLDAMVCLSLDSIRYLIVPRVIAAMVMIPVLVIFSELIAYIGSVITAIFFIDITLHVYLTGLRLFFSLPDMLIGIVKTTVFGAIISFCGAYFGYQSRKGAQGIGEATTRAVMTSMVLILFFDFLIAFLLLRSQY